MPKSEEFPIVNGYYRMTDAWEILLPLPFRRRFEEGALVLWHHGITAWIRVWNNDKGDSREKRLSRIKRDRSRSAFNEVEELGDGVLRYAYRLVEENAGAAGLYCFAISNDGHVQMAVYFDKEGNLPLAEGLWRNLRENSVTAGLSAADHSPRLKQASNACKVSLTMQNKKFYKSADQIKALANGYGNCFASDEILVAGRRVGYMYREMPDNDIDSGWRFLAGDESDEYMDNPNNLGLYDVNTVANYDPDIIPYLDAPIGSAFERDDENGELVLLPQDA